MTAAGLLEEMVRVGAAIYRRVLFGPLINLYLRGPTFNGWGFWGGRPAVEICASISNVSVEFWNLNPEVCRMLIERNVDSLVIAFETLVYYAIFAKLASMAASRVASLLSRTS